MMHPVLCSLRLRTSGKGHNNPALRKKMKECWKKKQTHHHQATRLPTGLFMPSLRLLYQPRMILRRRDSPPSKLATSRAENGPLKPIVVGEDKKAEEKKQRTRKLFYQPQAATPKTPDLQRLLYQPQAAMPTVLLLSSLMYTVVPSSDCNLIAVIADQLFSDVAADNFSGSVSCLYVQALRTHFMTHIHFLLRKIYQQLNAVETYKEHTNFFLMLLAGNIKIAEDRANLPLLTVSQR